MPLRDMLGPPDWGKQLGAAKQPGCGSLGTGNWCVTEPTQGISLGLYQRWGTVFLVSAVWAVCHEEAPLYPSISLDQVLQRFLLAGWSCAVLGIGVLCIQVLLHFFRQLRHLQDAELLHMAEVVQEKEALQQACAPVETSSGLPVSTGHALVDSLLVFLYLESMEEPSAANIQELAEKLERAVKALQRGASGEVLSWWGSEDCHALAGRLNGVSTYLQHRVGLLHTLAQKRRRCELSMQEVHLTLERCWEQLEKMHRRITVPSGGEEGLDVVEVLGEVKGLSAELSQHREQLQACQSHLAETTDILQRLSGSQRQLQQQTGTTAEPLWSERLLEASAVQSEEIHSKFLSLESTVTCLQTHLDGLKMQGVGCTQPLLPSWASASSTCPPALAEASPVTLSPPPSPTQTSHSLIPGMDCLCGPRRRK